MVFSKCAWILVDSMWVDIIRIRGCGYADINHIGHFGHLANLGHLGHLANLGHLGHLEHLKHLEHLGHFGHLTPTGLDTLNKPTLTNTDAFPFKRTERRQRKKP